MMEFTNFEFDASKIDDNFFVALLKALHYSEGFNCMTGIVFALVSLKIFYSQTKQIK